MSSDLVEKIKAVILINKSSVLNRKPRRLTLTKVDNLLTGGLNSIESRHELISKLSKIADRVLDDDSVYNSFVETISKMRR